jgi:bifunctional non-homologous end joining protein LigD
VQFGTLEVHPWGSTRDDLEHPDRFIIDLDPDEAIPWATLVESAQEIRSHLEAAGFTVFLKTTGGKGLHLVCPLDRSADWDVVVTLTELVARRLADIRPDRYVAEMAKRLRTNKIFVDYLRNTRGATAVAPYSTRAMPAATVSVPLHWDELDPKHDLRSRFTVATVPARMESIDDPWAGFVDAAAPITAWSVDAIGSITLRRAGARSASPVSSRRRARR